ncbi:MAG TPA: hypothetical protein VFQ63_00225 [Patescibacteria group bacterium]|nr:hypothetical protein [Patescibacteria group bacterium]
MKKIVHKYALFFSIILFVLTIAVAGKVFASENPTNTGDNGFTTSDVTPQQDSIHPTNTPEDIPSPTLTLTEEGFHPSLFPSRPVPTREPQEESSLTPHPTEKEDQNEPKEPAFTPLKLQGPKLQACQAIASSVTTRSTHLVELVNEQVKAFSSIALGVEQYYIKNVVPTGVSLPNYDSLVAQITTEQNAVMTPLAAAQADITSFSCVGNNPGAQLTQFKTDMQAVLAALQAYRLSIKNLIVAIVSLPAGTVTPTDNPTPTP